MEQLSEVFIGFGILLWLLSPAAELSNHFIDGTWNYECEVSCRAIGSVLIITGLLIFSQVS